MKDHGEEDVENALPFLFYSPSTAKAAVFSLSYLPLSLRFQM